MEFQIEWVGVSLRDSRGVLCLAFTKGLFHVPYSEHQEACIVIEFLKIGEHFMHSRVSFRECLENLFNGIFSLDNDLCILGYIFQQIELFFN